MITGLTDQGGTAHAAEDAEELVGRVSLGGLAHGIPGSLVHRIGSTTVKMLLRARAAPSPARPTAVPRNPNPGRPTTAARPKETAVSSGTAITPSTMSWPEK